MKKKRVNKRESFMQEPFKIPQIIKIDGIRTKKKYIDDAFVSPIFGRSVKDEVVAPYIAQNIGDPIKKYDAFRTKPKMDPKDATKNNGTKYYEFTDVVTNETRKTYFGEDVYIKKDDAIKEKDVIKPKDTIESIDLESSDSTPIFIETEPILEDDLELEVETYEIKKETLSLNKEAKPKNPRFKLPSVSIFSKNMLKLDEKPSWLLEQIAIIDSTLSEFAIDGKVAHFKKGPTVTRYEVALEQGVNVKRVSAIQDNIMMRLAAKSLRIDAPIPGKPYVGLEVPNVTKEVVAFGNVVDTKEFLNDFEHPLKVALGVDIDGENIYVDIAKMPHGLIAGTTNSGKSVCVNTILVSLLLKNTADDLRLILIDPKIVELAPYNGLPHLITPVITDAKIAASALNWAVDEMDRRYITFSKSRSRDIKSFNENISKGLINEKKMPYIVIVIDELADLMMIAAHDVEDAIQRLTQKARASGIHLLVATQRPTTDVVKGTIKSNIPTRIAFKVASFVDSTTILDGAGAESLLGKGDMLLKEGDRAHRLQGAYIPDEEIYKVTDFLKTDAPNYLLKHEDLKEQIKTKEIISDELFENVAYFVVSEKSASINTIQKEFTIGFNRAQKLVEMLEEYKIVSIGQGTRPREVLVNLNELDEILKESNL